MKNYSEKMLANIVVAAPDHITKFTRKQSSKGKEKTDSAATKDVTEQGFSVRSSDMNGTFVYEQNEISGNPTVLLTGGPFKVDLEMF